MQFIKYCPENENKNSYRGALSHHHKTKNRKSNNH
jgi:hypothetical protein